MFGSNGSTSVSFKLFSLPVMLLSPLASPYYISSRAPTLEGVWGPARVTKLVWFGDLIVRKLYNFPYIISYSTLPKIANIIR
jgi:hypothetical protein